ncbi:toxin C-terminal domain-containing protein [Acinetobacter baumannii]|nr:toxin C-terminal domain-containing protein [Acinetobacter baumannii]
MKYKILFISIFLAIHHTHAADIELAATLNGKSSVNSLGVLNHNIPLGIPTSLNGFVPSLSLNYNGESPDGILGVGWNIEGMSRVSRCYHINSKLDTFQTMGSSSFFEAIDYASNNPKASIFNESCFSLDGKKLIKISDDTVAASATEFRFEDDDFSRITLELEAGKATIKKFIVKTKEGITKEYATPLKSNYKDLTTGQYEVGNDITDWALSTVKDNNGNYWTVEYDDLKKGFLYPKSIKYTGNGAVAPLNSIDFEYVPRLDIEKRIVRTENVSERVLDKKLSKISLKVNNTLKGEYNFQYEDINDTEAKKTRLKTFNYCSVNGSDRSCTISTKVKWSSYGKERMNTPVRAGIAPVPSISDKSNVRYVSLSVKKGEKKLQTIISKDAEGLNIIPLGSEYSSKITHGLLSGFKEWYPIVMDINGDEIEDLVVYGKDNANKVSLLEFTASFNAKDEKEFKLYKEILNINTVPIPLTNIRVMDGNRDGINDLILTYADDNNIRFDGIKLDGTGAVSSVKTSTVDPEIITRLKNSTGNAKVPARILSGNFSRNKQNDVMLYYTDPTMGLGICAIGVYWNAVNRDTTLKCNSKLLSSDWLIWGAEGNKYKDYIFNVVDYNNDGLDDIVMSKVVRIDSANGASTRFKEELVPLLSRDDANSFELSTAIETPPFIIDTTGWGVDWESTKISSPNFADFNQDGLFDFYIYTYSFKPNLITFLQKPTKQFDIDNFSLNSWDKPTSQVESIQFSILGVPTSISPSNFKIDIIPALFDRNFDGIPDLDFRILAYPNTAGAKGFLYSIVTNATSNPPDSGFDGLISLLIPNFTLPDMLRSVEAGDGRKQTFSYKSVSANPEVQESKLFPVRGTSAPIWTVDKTFSYLNDVLGAQVTYDYMSPRVDVKDNRFLGFEKQTEKLETYNNPANPSAVSTTVQKETVFNQNYPFMGMPKSVTTKVNDALVSKIMVNDEDFISDSAYPTTKVKFPRIKKSTEQTYDLGKLISTSVTTDNYENIFGNLLDSTVTTTSADGATTFTNNVKATYSPHDIANWIPGLVQERTVSSARTGQSTIQKKTLFAYDNKQQLKQKIDEPDDAALRLQTDYSYDAYGNSTKVTVSGAGTGTDTNIGSRTLTSFYEAGPGYPAGVFKTREVNALSQQGSTTYDAVTGQVLSSTDTNGVTNTQKIDGIGRVVQSIPAVGAQTNTDYQLCKNFTDVGSNSSECEKGENYKITSLTALNAPVISYKDANGNVKRTVTKAYDNVNNIVVRNEYDPSGRLYRSSTPSLSNVGYGSLQWTSYEYDALGRIIKLTEPGNRVTTYTYNGLESSITNAKGLKRVEKKNIAGEVVEIIDHDNNSLKYSRDALGRLTQTTDALGRSISLTLDKNGNKLQQVDPVLGTWQYRYNPLGQVVWQKDAKGQVTTFQYDVLGRLTQRTEPELTSTWVWDSAVNGKGKLAQLTASNGFSESYAYDNFGRMYQTTTSKTIDPKAQGTSDPDFISKWNFDAAGRQLAYAYPTGFGYRNIYDSNGYLKEVRNLAGNQLYWAANARDARGNVTQETLGNGLVTKTAYKADTGFIESIDTGNAAIQQNTYAFDAIGNLTNRNQNLAGISINESFTYDNINRLKSVVNQKGETSSVNYDAIGNITSRSGKEAVNAAKSNNYTWTSFNMPLQIKQGTTTESFMYDANHERVRRTSVENGKTTTTVYINPRIDTGGSFEKSYLPNGTTEYTHHIYAGGDVIGSYVTNDKGTPPTGDLGSAYENGVAPNSATADISKTGPYRYFHKDHLNSIEVITDAAGNPLERLSYDSWGKRRNVDGTVASGVKGKNSIHGFTSHEMLDSIGLIHMNGRVYDPTIGRFISADPTIDGADSLQGYNRYAYVHNNPTTLLDPDGYGFLGKIGRELVRPFKQLGHALEAAVIKIDDDWLGNCSKSQGNCGMTVGVTYGPNNQGYYSADQQNINQYNNGQMTIQPYVGFGGPKNYYFINASSQNGELNFNGVGYSSNGELIPEYRIHASHLTAFSQYVFPNVQGSAARALNLDPYEESIWQTGSDGNQYACGNDNCNMVSGNATPVTWVEEYILGRIQYVGKAIGFYRSIKNTNTRSERKIVYPTDTEAQKAAKLLGYQKTNYRTRNKAAVFKKGNSYISRDVDGHNGGAWKEASSPEKLNSKETRNGTFDINLNRIGD